MAEGILSALGENGKAGGGGNGGQCFASEAQGGNGRKILGSADLAGGVTADAKRQILLFHPHAVIADTDHGGSALFDLRYDHGAFGVDGVFQQLF